VNGPKNSSNLDGVVGCPRTLESKPILSAISGRKVSGFGTVKPRVQIPGPRPFLNSETSSYAIRRAPGGPRGSQGDHKFLGEHGTSSPFEVVPGPLLNSGIVIRRPIF
jgi:hypothetical protein